MHEDQECESEKSAQKESMLSRRLPLVLGLIFLLAVASFAGAMWFYASHFSGPVSDDHGKWAEFGDFLGGTLNPLFALLGLLGLLLTIVLQNRELANSTRELATSARALQDQGASAKLQTFERTFFEMVRLHHDIVRAMDMSSEHEPLTGRECFGQLYRRFKSHHGQANQRHAKDGQAQVVTAAYSEFNEKYQDLIGHYFRNLHRILKFIDASGVCDKKVYTGILRAQLSSYELLLLFYNTVHEVGRNLRPLVEEYGMLENIHLPHLCNPSDEIGLLSRKAFGDLDHPLLPKTA
jgi:hypothetical protein